MGACHRSRLPCLDAGRANKATATRSPASSTRYRPAARNVAREAADFEAECRDHLVRHLQRQAKRLNLTLVDAACGASLDCFDSCGIPY